MEKNNHFKSQFIKAFSWSALQSAIKVLGNFIMGKLVAIWFGPSGLALLGQFQNLFFLQQSASGGAVQNGLIQGIAHHQEEEQQHKLVLESGIAITLLLTVLCIVFWIIGYPWIAQHWLPTNFPPLVYFFVPISLLFSSAFFIISSYFSAKKNYRSNAWINIFQSVFTVLFFILLGQLFGIYGACFGLLLGQIPAVLYGFKQFKQVFKLKIQWRWPQKKEDGLWSFALLALYSSLATQLNQIFIRSMIVDQVGNAEAGYWEALQRISNLWVPVLSVLFTTLFLPRLTANKTRKGFLKESIGTVGVAAILVGAFAVVGYLFRVQIVDLLFSKEFKNAESVMGVHLLGDVAKAITWAFAYTLLSRKKSILLLIIDLLFNVIYWSFAHFFIQSQGWTGAVFAYPMAMLVNLLFTSLAWSWVLSQQPAEKNV